MAYATYTDVQYQLGSRYTIPSSATPANPVTQAMVTAWLAGISALVDSALTRAGYGTIPATGTNDLAMLLLPVAREGARMVLEVTRVNDTLPEKERLLYQGFNDFLKRLETGQTYLIDQKPTSVSLTVVMPIVYGSDS